MPQLLIVAAIGAGAYFGAKWIQKKANQFTRNMERKAKAQKQQKSSQTPHSNIENAEVEELVKDPETGVYRVKKK